MVRPLKRFTVALSHVARVLRGFAIVRWPVPLHVRGQIWPMSVLLVIDPDQGTTSKGRLVLDERDSELNVAQPTDRPYYNAITAKSWQD